MKQFDNLILASQSPRRHKLLKEMGFEFEIMSIDVDESYPKHLPSLEVAEYISKKKAEQYTEHIKPGTTLITADSVVILGEKILGKPKDMGQAKEYLESLSDTFHVVVTGVCICSVEKQISFSDVSKVFLNPISDEEIHFYLENYKPLDKAGAYGIQEWFGHNKIEKIEGSYTNIMGLPTGKLYDALMSF